MTKTSRKTLKPPRPAPRTRNDHAAGCRLSDAQLAQVNADIKELGGIAPTLSGYTKHAVLLHGRLRRQQAKFRNLAERLANVDPADGSGLDEIALEMKQILEAP